jgi:hypothetical protein
MEVKTSLQIYRVFIRVDPETQRLVSALGSRECFDMWQEKCTQQNKASSSRDAAKRYQRTVTGHLNAADGRSPFTPEEEAAVLEEVRQKRTWPCFLHLPPDQHLGSRGYRAQGFHERRSPRATAAAKQEEEEDPDQVVNAPELYTEFARLGGVSIEAQWEMSRFIFFSKTPAIHFTNRTPEYALELIARTEREVNNPARAIVMVVDHGEKEFRKRFVGQNELSRLYFGNVLGDCQVELVAEMDGPEDLMGGVAQLAFLSMLSPGTAFEGLLPFRFANGESHRVQVAFKHDPESYFMVVLGFVSFDV